jgi:protein-disulfide isomerase
MKFTFLLAALPALLLAACGSGSGGSGDAGNATSVAPVAAAKPPAGKNWVDVVSKTADGGYVMGNPDAPVKMIEYGSRLCPFCARFDAEGFPALKAGPIAAGKLSYEFRDFPVHGAADFGPAVLGQCVEPSIFFPLLDQMMSSQQAILGDEAHEGALFKNVGTMQQANATPSQIATKFAEDAGYIAFVQQRGVPETKARACLADPKAYEQIAKLTDDAANKYQVSGTPTFIVNGVTASNVNDWAQLQPILKNAGAL